MKPKTRKTTRKAIQIMSNSGHLYSLCNDGTIWHWEYIKGIWEQIGNIPTN